MGKQVPEKNSRPSNWKTYHLNEVYNFASGLSKNRKEFGFGFPFLSFKEVFNSYFLPRTLASLANTTDVERQRCSVKRGDAFLTRTSETQEELGMSSVALVDYPDATFNGFTKRLRPNGSVEAYPEYVGYYFRSPIFRATMTSMASMTTRASLNNEMLAALKIVLPPLSEQKAIAQVLSSLDDKIDLLHRQNKTLEAIAQTLFRQWFIEEAQDDWEKKELKDILEFVVDNRGKTAPTSETGIPLIATNCVRKNNIFPVYEKIRYVSEETYRNWFRSHPEPGDLIFVNKGTPGCVNLVPNPVDFCIAQDMIALRVDKNYVSNYYLFLFLRSEDMQNQIFNSSVGTTIPHLKKADLLSFNIVIPTAYKLNEFSEIVEPFFLKMNTSFKQIRTLEKLRDTLLPKLMSGEVRVDIGAFAKAA